MSPTVRQMLWSTAQVVMMEDKDVVNLQSLEEQAPPKCLQHAKAPLNHGVGLGMFVEVALPPPFWWLRIWGDDGHRIFNVGIATITHNEEPCR